MKELEIGNLIPLSPIYALGLLEDELIKLCDELDEKDIEIAHLTTKVAELEQKVDANNATITAIENEKVRLKQQVSKLMYEDNKAHLEKVMGVKPYQASPCSNTNSDKDDNNSTTSSDVEIKTTNPSDSSKSQVHAPATSDKKFVERMVCIASKLRPSMPPPLLRGRESTLKGRRECHT